jgi:hypothetical protein
MAGGSSSRPGRGRETLLETLVLKEDLEGLLAGVLEGSKTRAEILALNRALSRQGNSKLGFPKNTLNQIGMSLDSVLYTDMPVEEFRVCVDPFSA